MPLNIVFEELTTNNWSSFESLFSKCEQCSECWCLNHRVPASDAVTGDRAKEKMKDLTKEGKVGGLLGFIDKTCIAWVSVDPIETQVGHDYVVENDITSQKNTWMVHCIYITPEYRNKGLSKSLIQEAISFAKSKGASKIIAFPIPSETRNMFPQDEAEFSGRHSSFEKAGFISKKKMNKFYELMELDLNL